MSPLYEYLCPFCDDYYEEMHPLSESDKPILCHCGHYAERVILSAPCLVSSKNWSAGPFHAHFDEQLGQHFDTKQEKEEYLIKKGLTQTEGPPSPESTQKSRPKMSKSQAKRYDAMAMKRNAIQPK